MTDSPENPIPACQSRLSLFVLAIALVLNPIARASTDSVPIIAGKIEPHGIVGSCPKMLDLLNKIQAAANTPLPVMILGETGSGKELIARALHTMSERRQKPFVAINMAAIPEALAESTLFGHEKGAFSGATHTRDGVFQQAEGGTLFLDEIGETPLDLQAKILRALDPSNGGFTRVGGKDLLRPNVRIVVATNREPETEMRAKRFRPDLFFRLSVLVFRVPPLRERTDDIPALAAHILRQHGFRRELSLSAIEKLQGYDWPGNVRQLENVLLRATVFADEPLIQDHDIDFGPRFSSGDEAEFQFKMEELLDKRDPKLLGEGLAAVERIHYIWALEQARWNLNQAASKLTISVELLRKKIKEHEIILP